MTNRGSDCVTGNNLDKRWREDWKGRKKKGNGKRGRQGNKETGKGECGGRVGTEVRLCGISAGRQYLQ